MFSKNFFLFEILTESSIIIITFFLRISKIDKILKKLFNFYSLEIIRFAN